MEDEGLQPPPQTINIEEAEIIEEEEEKGGKDDEEFYEKIEAPKFVDFTKPNPFRPDDRYWFCSRVGCDQKHEEEIDPEEISKNFVLRVMAARSPKIKLQKTVDRKHSSMKCPLTAPAKPSKARISRLVMVSPISHKIVDLQSKSRPVPKVNSTPMAKSRQVAARYMTTPRNKRCLPNPNSFRSVQNPKPTTVHVPKNRTIAKALVFHSPKKAINLKRSVELHAPLTKICEGMKRLEITSKKKASKDMSSNPKKPAAEDSSRWQLKIRKGEKRTRDLLPSQNCEEQESKSSKSTKTQSKKIVTKKCHSLHQDLVENESSNKDVDVKPRDCSMLGELSPYDSPEKEATTISLEWPQSRGSSDTSLSDGSRDEMNCLPHLEDKENTRSAKDHSSEVVAANEIGQMDTDDKENAFKSEDINREFSNHQLGVKILGSKDVLAKKKVVQTLGKNMKAGLTATGAGPEVVKYKKPKPTNVKTFRLRTDERGILKEAILERKLHFPAPEKVAEKDTTNRTYHIQRNEKVSDEQRKCNYATVDICGKKSGRVTSRADLKISRGQVGSKLATDTPQKHPESTHRRPQYMTSPLGKTENSFRSRLLCLWQQPQVVASPNKVMRSGSQLRVMKEKSSKITEPPKEAGTTPVAENITRPASASRSTPRGKRPVTIAKEPNFQSLHLPRSCTKKLA